MKSVIIAVVCLATAVAVAQQEGPSTNAVPPQVSSGTNAIPQQMLSGTNDLGKLSEIVVTAGRLPGENQSLAKTPVNATVITRDQIQQLGDTSVPEILAHQVGIHNTDTVGFGIDSKPNMRGFGDRTGVLVLVDGVRVNSPGDSTSNAHWPAIPAQDIQRIEIIRGGGSVIYGEGAIGGVINIITKPDITNGFANINASAGTYGYWSSHADGGTPVGPSRVYGYGTYTQGDGARDFSSFYTENAHGSAGVTTAWGDFDTDVYYTKDRTRNPGNLSGTKYQQNPDQVGGYVYQFDDEITRWSLDWKKAYDSGLSAQVKTYIASYTEVMNSSASVAGPWTKEQISQPSWGATMQLNHVADVLGGENRATFGFEFVHQNYYAYDGAIGWTGDGLDEYVNYDTYSVFAQDAVDVIEQLRLQAGIRYDGRYYDYSMFNWGTFSRDAGSRTYDGFSPGFGAVYSFTKTESAYVNVSQSYKLPIGSDLISVDPAYHANANINQIKATNYEVGFRWNPRKEFGGSVALYHTDLHNAIETNPFTYQNQNFDETHNGIEFGLQSKPVDQIFLYANYTLQNSTFKGGTYDGKQVPLAPEQTIATGVAWTPVRWLRWSWDVIYTFNQVPNNDLNNVLAQNSYTLVNTRLTWLPCKWAQVYLGVNNVLNKRYDAFPSSSGTVGSRVYNPAQPLFVQGGFSMKF